MLDVPYSEALIEQTWARVGCQVKLPPAIQREFLALSGATPRAYDDERRHPRYHFRRKAIMYRRGELSCIYTMDLSRSGIRFLLHEQLLPCEVVDILLPSDITVKVETRWCRRLQRRCFECGAETLRRGTLDHWPPDQALDGPV